MPACLSTHHRNVRGVAARLLKRAAWRGILIISVCRTENINAEAVAEARITIVSSQRLRPASGANAPSENYRILLKFSIIDTDRHGESSLRYRETRGYVLFRRGVVL